MRIAFFEVEEWEEEYLKGEAERSPTEVFK